MNRENFLTFYNRLQATNTRYCECIRIETADGKVQRFTSHDEELVVEESDGARYTYQPADSFKLTALERQQGLAVDNMDIQVLLDDKAIGEAAVIAGEYNNAKLNMFLAIWNNPAIPILPLRVSWIGELTTKGESFQAELRGITARLAQTFIQTTSLECRHQFCDAKCTLSRSAFTVSATIGEAISQGSVVIGSINSDGRYANGLIKFTSGDNAGLSMEILQQYGLQLNLFLPMPYEIRQGDQVELLQGCPRTYTACRERFDNGVNFGGEPHMAGSDILSTYQKQIEQG